MFGKCTFVTTWFSGVRVTSELIWLALLSNVISFAQIGGQNDFSLRGAVNFGSLIVQGNVPNAKTFKYVNGLELNYIKPSTGKKLWQHENNFPQHGFGLSIFNLNDPKVLGNLYAGYIFCDIPLNKIENPFRLYFRLAAGIAYSPVYYNRTSNQYNEMISTPVNGYGNLKWYFRWDLGRKLCWDLGFNFSHVSNGNSNLPNWGENIIAVNTGLVYKFNKPFRNVITSVDSGTKVKSRSEIFLWAGTGRIQEKAFGKKYLAQDYSVSYFHNIRNTHKIGLGIDVFYDAGNIELLNKEGITLSNNLQNLEAGLKLVYAYNLGRLSLPLELGYFAISKYKYESSFYQRLGARYYFKNNIVALITLKTYWIGAYNFEFGIGYRFGLKK